MKKIVLLAFVLTPVILSAYASQVDSPCELISLEEVKKRFNLDASVEISLEDKAYTYPTCSISWKDGKVTKSMDVGGQSIEVELDSELLIVMVKDANASMYETSISVYTDGIIEDAIGDKATWSDKRAQLTFLSDNYLFHVHVRASNDNVLNRKHAVEIAGSIIAKL